MATAKDILSFNIYTVFTQFRLTYNKLNLRNITNLQLNRIQICKNVPLKVHPSEQNEYFLCSIGRGKLHVVWLCLPVSSLVEQLGDVSDGPLRSGLRGEGGVGLRGGFRCRGGRGGRVRLSDGRGVGLRGRV